MIFIPLLIDQQKISVYIYPRKNKYTLPFDTVFYIHDI